MPFYDQPLLGKLAVQPCEPTVAEGAAVGQVWSDNNAPCGALYLVTCICGCCVTSVQVGAGCGCGNVVGPACSIDNAITRFSGTTGKIIQGYSSNTPTISDSGAVVLASTLTLGGTVSRAASLSLDLTGVATRTLTLVNSTACQVADLDISDGKLLVDTIAETTAAAGVTIDGVLLKDSLIAVCYGGTGATCLTDGGVLLGSGTGAITALGQPTNGQLIIGSTGADPVVASVTAGVGIDVCVDAGSLTIIAETASATSPGIAELATVAELDTGTDTGRTITPDVLAGSKYGIKTVPFFVHCSNCCCALTTGDGKVYFRVPAYMCGWALQSCPLPAMSVTTASSSGLPTVQLRRTTAECACPVDMLSTKLTIDACEKDSSTAVAAAVVNTCNDNVSTGQKIHIDVDIAGTGTKGLYVDTHWRAP